MHGVTLSHHQPICVKTEYIPDFLSFFFVFFLFFLFSIDPQVLHDLEREYDNEFLASIDPEQPVSSRTNYLDRK